MTPRGVWHHPVIFATPTSGNHRETPRGVILSFSLISASGSSGNHKMTLHGPPLRRDKCDCAISAERIVLVTGEVPRYHDAPSPSHHTECRYRRAPAARHHRRAALAPISAAGPVDVLFCRATASQTINHRRATAARTTAVSLSPLCASADHRDVGTSSQIYKPSNRHSRRYMTRPLRLRCANFRVPPFCYRCAGMGKSPLFSLMGSEFEWA
ncbi:hypothetical protein E2542_SST13086 [Spatholobus suberectus]|nr:hypothetical protein E2542_SST13086 [Spatholobus suberectus]